MTTKFRIQQTQILILQVRSVHCSERLYESLTAAPTIFKPVKVKDVLYCDGGIVASNPTGIAIHEAKTLFPDVPIELVGKLDSKVCISFKVKFRVTEQF
jgi:hypothetical protein